MIVSPLERIAHHEAGHAVPVWISGGSLFAVTIVPSGATLGAFLPSESSQCDVKPRTRPWKKNPFGPARFLCPELAKEQDEIAMSSLGGAVADSILLGGLVRQHGPDIHNVAEIGLLATGSWRAARQYLRQMRIETEKLLRANWWIVHRLAFALLKYKTLSAEEIDRVCRGFEIVRKGEIIRGYHSDQDLVREPSGLAQTPAAGGEVGIPGARRVSAAAAFQSTVDSPPTSATGPV